MAFDDRFLEDLRLRADIVDVISSYIPLKKTGANFKALCPFHKEKTPSFVVSPEKQIFHCFGCGKGGNVFSFIMEKEGVSFPEAVEILAAKYNVSVPRDRKKQTGSLKIADLYSVNNYAMRFFHRNLFSDAGKGAIKYLLSRGLSMDTIKAFNLGYALDSWDAFTMFARRKKVPLRLLLESGLALKKQGVEQGLYDRFRNRIIFPVFDAGKRVLGFGARVLDDSLPKYINSPETRLFKKASILYGIDLAKEYIKEIDTAILVEGYMDVIALWQAGIKNGVAVLGTAFTDAHANLIRRYAKKVIMLFDSDEAGLSAIKRGAQSLLASDLSVKVVRLPDAKDPDEFIKLYGKQRFLDAIESGQDLFDFLLAAISRQYDMADIKSKNVFIKELFGLIRLVSDSIIRSDYLFKLAEFTRMKPALIEQAFVAYLKKQKDFVEKREADVVTPYKRMRFSAEKEALALALLYPDLSNDIVGRLSAVDFDERHFLLLWELMDEALKRDRELSVAFVMAEAQNRNLTGLDEFFMQCLKRPAITEDRISMHVEKVFQAIDKRRLDKQIHIVKDKIQQAREKGDSEVEEELVGHLNLLFKQRGGASFGKGRI